MPPCKDHIWSDIPPVSQWCPASIGYIPWFTRALWSLDCQPQKVTPTLRSLYAAPSSPQSIWLTDNGMPLVFIVWPPSLLNSFSHITKPTVLLTCKAPPAPLTLNLSSSTPFPASPTVALPSEGYDTGPPSKYCYMQLCFPVMRRPRPAPKDISSRWSTPGLYHNSVVASPIWSVVPPRAFTNRTHSAGSWGAMVESDSHTSHIWGTGWAVTTISVGFPPNTDN